MTEQVDKTTEMSRDEKIDRLDYVARRKNFIRTFEENGGGLDDDCLTKTEIFKHFKLNSEEDFVKLMKENEESFEEIMTDVFQLVVKSKREKIKEKLETEWNVLKDRIGKNDTKSIDVIHSGNSQITILPEALKQIHPVQDFFEGNAFTTVILPYTEKKEVREGIFNETTSNGKFLINNNRESPIFLNKNVMQKGIGNNIYLKVFPEYLEPRWEMRSVVSFLNGNNPHYTLEEIFEEIKAHIKFYIQLEDENQFDIVACWIIATYFFEMFDAFGYLYLTGTKGCGKTKLLKIVASLAFNGKMNVGIKSASLFRSVHGSKLTLCLDEIDANTLKNDTDLNELLRGGYMKGHSVPRVEKNAKTGVFEVKQHELYSPKALCNITGIDDVIEDRAIPIVMVRANNEKLSKNDANVNDLKWQQTRNKLYIYMMENFKDIEKNINAVKNFDLKTISVGVANDGNERFENDDNAGHGVGSHGWLFEKTTILQPSPQLPMELSGNENIDISNISNISDTTPMIDNNKNIHIYRYDIDRLEGHLDGVLKNDKQICVQELNNDGDVAKKVSITQRNYQIALPILSIAYGISYVNFEKTVQYLSQTFDRKRIDANYESSDNTLMEVLVSLVDTRRWWKIATVVEDMKMRTDEQWANSKWVIRAMKRMFPKIDKRRTQTGVEVYLSPNDVQTRATRNGIDVAEIIKNRNFNELGSMSDNEKIRFKLKKEKVIFDWQLKKWAIEQGIEEVKIDKIIQHLINDGAIAEIRTGTYRWELG